MRGLLASHLDIYTLSTCMETETQHKSVCSPASLKPKHCKYNKKLCCPELLTQILSCSLGPALQLPKVLLGLSRTHPLQTLPSTLPSAAVCYQYPKACVHVFMVILHAGTQIGYFCELFKVSYLPEAPVSVHPISTPPLNCHVSQVHSISVCTFCTVCMACGMRCEKSYAPK